MRSPIPVLIVLTLAALAVPAAALTIDDFEVGNFNILDDSVLGAATLGEQSGLATSSVVGGVRLVSVLGSSGGTGVATAAAVLATAPVVDDGAALSVVVAPPGAGTGQVQFIYDGSANSVNNGSGGSLNLNLSALTSFDITSTLSSVTANAQVTLYSSTTTRDGNVALVNGTASIPMSTFTLNLADIQAIRVWITGLDVGEAPIITNIAATPEPTTGLLLAAGLVALGAHRRRAH